MRVKCIDNSDQNAGANAANHLVVGQTYEVKESTTNTYKLIGVAWIWYQSAFKVLSDEACPQCGNIHETPK
jgi:hypothetical protein